MNFPTGIDDYKKLRERNYVFVDKTELIKDFLEDGAETRLVCRPRRFGKTLNMSMLSYFFALQDAKENKALFADTKIATLKTAGGKKCLDYQGQYPAIFLSLKDFKGNRNFQEFLEQLGDRIANICRQHPKFFMDRSPIDPDLQHTLASIKRGTATHIQLKNSLYLLTEALHSLYNKPVMVFLDEYDAPMQAAFMAEEPYDKPVMDFMTDFLGRTFKSNQYLARGLLTGIAQISLMNLFSGMNNVPVATLLSPEYTTYFGFSKSEVAALVDQAKLPTAILQDIEDWYNGYGLNEQQIYNPWSVINCLANGGKTGPYWNESGEHGIIGRCLLNSSDPETLAQFRQLVEGNSIEAVYKPGLIWKNITNRHALWSLLLTTGYLNVTADSGPETIDERIISLKIPNYEVKQVFTRIIRSWTQAPGGSNPVYEDVIACLKTGNITTFCNTLKDYLLQTTSYYDFSKHTSEKFYHVFMLGLMFSLQADFIVESNKESGMGRPDIILIPRDKEKYPTGIIFELKSVQSQDITLGQAPSAAHTATMEQITSKHYPATLKQHYIKKALHVSMVFCGKDAQVSCEQVEY